MNGAFGKAYNNTDSVQNLHLKGRRKLLPYSDLSATVSEYDEYLNERSACTKVRLTCQVATFCTNALFNQISEVVKDEGSSGMSFLNYGILNDSNLSPIGKTKDYFTQNASNSIRDTQLSSKGFVYHCGKDFFNNHLVRSNTFKTVCKINGNDENFNTIGDMMRDVNGNKVEERVAYPVSSQLSPKSINLHLYEYDDILSFNDCLEQRLIKKYNGWLGLYNMSKIKSYSDFVKDEELPIERPLMYMQGGDFIDMYPSRDLYSFVPKYNVFQDRIEKNWNYCLTYPSSSTTSGFEDIISDKSGGLKAIYYDETTVSDNGSPQLVVYSIAKHGLQEGDSVNIYKDSDDGSEVILQEVFVTDIVDDFIFVISNPPFALSANWLGLDTVQFSSAMTFVYDSVTYKVSSNHKYICPLNADGTTNEDEKHYIVNSNRVNMDASSLKISYKKTSNGIPCEYYVRIFSKIPNFKFASETVNEYEMYKDGSTLIDKYQSLDNEFESHVSRLAFAKNIYGDDIGQVVFTDTIDIGGLRDNLGRPLTSIYMTIIKNNKGYKEWYGEDYPNWTVDAVLSEYKNIEFSHCFGKVSCGIEASVESATDGEVTSINTLRNTEMKGEGDSLGFDVGFGYNIDAINGDRKYQNSSKANVEIDLTEVWYEQDKHFYGDLVCYDTYNAREESIQQILMRFNSAQREAFSNPNFNTFEYDEIERDDYDSEDYRLTTKTVRNCNNFKEGYYYQPHYEIPIRTFGKLQSIMPMTLAMRSLVSVSNGRYRIAVLQNHYLSKGDKSILYDKENDSYMTCITVESPSEKVYICEMYDENNNKVTTFQDLFNGSEDMLKYKLFKADNLEMPSYATLLKDGTCRYIWRNVLQNGFDKDAVNVEEYPFTNGALYVNKKIDLFLKRQDPFNFYGMYDERDEYGREIEAEEIDTYIKEEDIKC